MKKTLKIIALLMVFVMVLMCFAACGDSSNESAEPEATDTETTETETEATEPEVVEPEPEPVTVESLFEGHKTKLASAEDISFNLNLALSMSMFGTAMDMVGDLTCELQGDNAHTYGKMTTSGDPTGEGGNEESEVDTYTIKEGDKYVAYTKGENGWEKEDTTSESIDGLKQMLDANMAVDLSKFTLTEENGMNVVSGELELEEALKALGDMMGDMDPSEMGVSDTEGISPVTIKYVFNGENLDSMQINMTEAMKSMMMKSIEEQGGSTEGIDMEQIASLFSINTMEFNLSNIRINSGIKVVAPEA